MRSLNSVGFTWEQGLENGGSLVLDFSIYYDNGDGTAELIKTQYTQLNYMIDTLQPGVTYGFWIKARNEFGFSDSSEIFYILCATVPDPPVAPLTVTVASDVTISWALPNENGSPITSYKVFLRAHDGVYIQETVHCAATPEMVQGRTCTMPLLVLISAPYSLALGDSIYAKIIAINYYGQSVYSSAGNGATCVLVPSAPIELANDQSVTDTTQIAFTWTNGATSGGKKIIDWRVSYDQGMDSYVVLDSAVLTQRYVTTVSLIAGETYKFKVEARNDVGYSSPSQEISILAATFPDPPSAPTTIISGDNVVIQWVAPYNGGTPLTAYIVEIQKSDG